jgi:K+ transporter
VVVIKVLDDVDVDVDVAYGIAVTGTMYLKSDAGKLISYVFLSPIPSSYASVGCLRG